MCPSGSLRPIDSSLHLGKRTPRAQQGRGCDGQTLDTDGRREKASRTRKSLRVFMRMHTCVCLHMCVCLCVCVFLCVCVCVCECVYVRVRTVHHDMTALHVDI